MIAHLALLLGAGWLVLVAPPDKPLTTPLGQWEREGEYDTAYTCEQARRAAVAEWRKESRRPGVEAELRHRCVRVEHVPTDR